ncbi:hypothetical protein E2C01_101682 [Portunus trituberculatus]|uniref:Uncharacterized protein n=1 Tax=Portunus trituberculatus TaxID=210409 RepID=A0A5B7KFI4_PORTR|nr:hypothetical protein [Portunus trituberculatus]
MVKVPKRLSATLSIKLEKKTTQASNYSLMLSSHHIRPRFDVIPLANSSSSPFSFLCSTGEPGTAT